MTVCHHNKSTRALNKVAGRLQPGVQTGLLRHLDVPGDSGDPYDLVPLVDYRKENRGKNSEEFLVKYAQNNSSRPKNLQADSKLITLQADNMLITS